MKPRDLDMEAAILAATDRGEAPSLMKPMLIRESSQHRGPLTDLAVELIARSAGFRRGLPEGVRAALSDLVRTTNCYYSNCSHYVLSAIAFANSLREAPMASSDFTSKSLQTDGSPASNLGDTGPAGFNHACGSARN